MKEGSLTHSLTQCWSVKLLIQRENAVKSEFLVSSLWYCIVL